MAYIISRKLYLPELRKFFAQNHHLKLVGRLFGVPRGQLWALGFGVVNVVALRWGSVCLSVIYVRITSKSFYFALLWALVAQERWRIISRSWRHSKARRSAEAQD